MFVEEKRSSKCPLGFSVSGKARWSLNNVILPSEWSENVKWVVRESDYIERNRVIELFNVKKGCREFVERTNNIKYVHYEGNSTVIDDNCIDIDDNKHLPVVSVSVLVTADEYSDKNINDLIVTNDTEGDLTLPDVDMTYDKIINGDNPWNYYYGCLLYTSRCV